MKKIKKQQFKRKENYWGYFKQMKSNSKIVISIYSKIKKIILTTHKKWIISKRN
jgi:hypothetical protein